MNRGCVVGGIFFSIGGDANDSRVKNSVLKISEGVTVESQRAKKKIPANKFDAGGHARTCARPVFGSGME